MGDCPICARGGPLDVLVDLGVELPPDKLDAFWREAMCAARGVAKAVSPKNMNYEIHGNTIPHLHMHLFPRFEGDPYEGGPIDPRLVSFTRSRDDLEQIASAIAAEC